MLSLFGKVVPRGRASQRSLTTSVELLKQCGGGGRRRDADDICQESRPCKSGVNKKVKKCPQLQQEEGEEVGGEVPEMCSRQAALDCARKLEDLQKQWEQVARAVERAETAAQLAGSSKRASGCPVKPPPKPEKGGSAMPAVLGLTAVIAGVAYYLYTQAQEGEGAEDKDNKDKDKKDE